MKLLTPYLLTLTFAFTCPLLAQPAPNTSDALDAAANTFIDQLARNDFVAATNRFDATMNQAMPPAKLERVWQSLQGACGPFDRRGASYRESVTEYEIVYIPCQFQNKTLAAKIVFDQQKKITGLFFVPHRPNNAYQAPAYVDPTAFVESEITVGAAPWELPGTLAVPTGAGPFPAVVLVHGSGPNDRDETVGANKPFKDLGAGLASRGVVTLRYDKRTKVHGAKIANSKAPFTVRQETVDDAIAAVRLLKANPSVDDKRVFVVGHSLGAYLAPRIAAQDDQRLIAGFILLAGNTRPIEDLMWEQTNYIYRLDGKLSDTEQAQLNQLKKMIDQVKSTDLADASPNTAILGATPSYWLDLRGYDPAQQAAGIDRPMLILQGERDYQVTMEDFRNWKQTLASHNDIRFKSYPNLNHLFITGRGKSTPTEYKTRGAVSESVIDDIVNWIDHH
jgi:dienelactone hydrolase